MSQDKSQHLQQQHRRLAAFDFDYTIVAQNSDTVVRDLLPREKIAEKELSELVNIAGWTEYMTEVFRLLHQRRVTPARIRDVIRSIPEVPGMVRLIKRLYKSNKFDMIIVSDSNSEFIDEWLQAHSLANCFVNIFTNPAKFDSDTGLLSLSPYHRQTECKLSAANLCKGRVLEHFVIEQDLRHNIRYDHVLYVGDGNNDICPVLRLRCSDYACARHGYAMEKNLNKNSSKFRLRGKLLVWKNGFDLLEQLESVSLLSPVSDNIDMLKSSKQHENTEATEQLTQ